MAWYLRNATATRFGATRYALDQSDVTSRGTLSSGQDDWNEGSGYIDVYLYTCASNGTLTQCGMGTGESLIWDNSESTIAINVTTSTAEIPSNGGVAVKLVPRSWSGYLSTTQTFYSPVAIGQINATTHSFSVRGKYDNSGKMYAYFGAADAYGPDNIVPSVSPPTVTTSAVSSITTSTAKGNGNVTSDGGGTITERGVCWVAGSGTPTTANSKVIATGTTGTYDVVLSPLTSGGALYSVRAYAINAAGTSYGSIVTFRTDVIVDYDANGGSVTPTVKSFDYNTAIGTLPTPTRTGYTFHSWNSNSAGTGTTITAATVYTASAIIYAKWTINTYTVTYNRNLSERGTLSRYSENVNYGSNALGSTATPNTGYYFVNWTGYATSTSNPIVPTSVGQDRVYTANFAYYTYTVTFKNWDGSILKSEVVNYGYNATPPADPTRPGYTFTGWSGTYTNVTSTRNITATYVASGPPTPLKIYTGGTTGLTNGTLETPRDQTGLTLTTIGTTAVFHMRCGTACQNAEQVIVNAPTDCEVSKDGSAFGATAIYAIGNIKDVNVPCTVKRTASTVTETTWLGLTTTPRVQDIETEYY